MGTSYSKSEKQTATDAEQQANKQAEMAQTVVNRPDKSELLDSLKKNTFIIVLFLLTGCSHTVKYVCPPLPKYSVEFANKAALQIQDIPDNTPVITILEDTMAFRKACGY